MLVEIINNHLAPVKVTNWVFLTFCLKFHFSGLKMAYEVSVVSIIANQSSMSVNSFSFSRNTLKLFHKNERN